MNDLLNDLMGMHDDRAIALSILESHAPHNPDAARDLVMLKNYALAADVMAAWISEGMFGTQTSGDVQSVVKANSHFAATHRCTCGGHAKGQASWHRGRGKYEGYRTCSQCGKSGGKIKEAFGKMTPGDVKKVKADNRNRTPLSDLRFFIDDLDGLWTIGVDEGPRLGTHTVANFDDGADDQWYYPNDLEGLPFVLNVYQTEAGVLPEMDVYTLPKDWQSMVTQNDGRDHLPSITDIMVLREAFGKMTPGDVKKVKADKAGRFKNALKPENWEMRMLGSEPEDADPLLSMWFEDDDGEWDDMYEEDEMNVTDRVVIPHKVFANFVEDAKEACKVDLTNEYQVHIMRHRSDIAFCSAAARKLAKAGYFVYDSDTRLEVYDASTPEEAEQLLIDESITEAGFGKQTPDDVLAIDHENAIRDYPNEVERVNREAARKDYIAKIPTILRKLGMTKMDPPERFYLGTEITGRNKAGEAISIIYNEENKRPSDAKYIVKGEYPRLKGENYIGRLYNAEHQELTFPHINVSVRKSSDQIVADINRRFIPDWKVLHAAAVARVKQWEEHNGKVARNIKLITGRPATDDELKKGQIDSYNLFRNSDVYGDIQVSSDSVRMTLNSLTPEQAKKILKIARKNPTTEELVTMTSESAHTESVTLEDLTPEQAKEIMDIITGGERVAEAFGKMTPDDVQKIEAETAAKNKGLLDMVRDYTTPDMQVIGWAQDHNPDALKILMKILGKSYVLSIVKLDAFASDEYEAMLFPANDNGRISSYTEAWVQTYDDDPDITDVLSDLVQEIHLIRPPKVEEAFGKMTPDDVEKVNQDKATLLGKLARRFPKAAKELETLKDPGDSLDLHKNHVLTYLGKEGYELNSHGSNFYKLDKINALKRLAQEYTTSSSQPSLEWEAIDEEEYDYEAAERLGDDYNPGWMPQKDVKVYRLTAAAAAIDYNAPIANIDLRVLRKEGTSNVMVCPADDTEEVNLYSVPKSDLVAVVTEAFGKMTPDDVEKVKADAEKNKIKIGDLVLYTSLSDPDLRGEIGVVTYLEYWTADVKFYSFPNETIRVNIRNLKKHWASAATHARYRQENN